MLCNVSVPILRLNWQFQGCNCFASHEKSCMLWPGPVAQETMEKMETEVETLLACWSNCTLKRIAFEIFFCYETSKELSVESVKSQLRQRRFQPFPWMTVSYRLVQFPRVWGWWRRRGGDVRRCGRSRRRGKFALLRLIHPVALEGFELCEGQLCLISHGKTLGERRTGSRGSSRRGELQTLEIQRDFKGAFLERPTQLFSLGSSQSSHNRLRQPDCHKLP